MIRLKAAYIVFQNLCRKKIAQTQHWKLSKANWDQILMTSFSSHQLWQPFSDIHGFHSSLVRSVKQNNHHYCYCTKNLDRFMNKYISFSIFKTVELFLAPVRCCRSRSSSDFSGHLSRRYTLTSRSRGIPEQTAKSRNLKRRLNIDQTLIPSNFNYILYYRSRSLRVNTIIFFLHYIIN